MRPPFSPEQTERLRRLRRGAVRIGTGARGADFAYANDRGRFRASVARHRLGTDLVFRVINTRVRTMEELVYRLPKMLTVITNGFNSRDRLSPGAENQLPWRIDRAGSTLAA